MVSFLYCTRTYDEALRQAQKTFELDSTFSHLEAEPHGSLWNSEGVTRRSESLARTLARAA